ncbi:phage tail fiber domain-containing protein, partial [Serratia marcescens]|uniref:phage tail fiber domain-containing protein n=2 Tax=Serratia marcescens TaxID=615 RepID=UPI0027E41383
MSVPNQTPYNIYTANGLTTVFPYEFYLLNAGDLAVSLNGSVITSGYTISGVGNVDGGEVSFLTPPENGVTVMLERVIPTYRLTDYQDNGDMLADTVNKDFDRLWMAIQQAFIYLGLALTRPLLGGPFNAKGYRIENLGYPVNSSDAANRQFVEDVAAGTLNRTLRVPENYVRVIPAIGSRRRQLLAFDDFGNPITVLPESGSASDVLIVLAGADGADRIGMGQSTVRDVIGYVTPEMFGVPDDGDWTPQITAAVATMREVHLMAGKEYRCDGTIYMPSNNMQRLKFVFNGAT